MVNILPFHDIHLGKLLKIEERDKNGKIGNNHILENITDDEQC